MNVYVLFEEDHEGDYLLAVFSTPEKAMEAGTAFYHKKYPKGWGSKTEVRWNKRQDCWTYNLWYRVDEVTIDAEPTQ